VLRLSPDNLLAQTKLQELEPPPGDRQIVSSRDAQTGAQDSSNRSRQDSNYVPNQHAYPAIDNSRDDSEIINYFIVGIVAFLAILYVVITGNFSNYSNILCAGLFFISLSAAVIILSAINKNRG
jgi:hypothetical protein